MTVKSYRKKPAIIQAMLFEDTAGSAADIVVWITRNGRQATYAIMANFDSPSEFEVHIQTLEGRMTAKPGDYIIRGVAGEFYPCKADIFAATYEPA